MRRLISKLEYLEWRLYRCFAYAVKGSVSRAQNWAVAAGGLAGFCLDIAGLKMTSVEGWQSALLAGLLGIGTAWVLLILARFLYALFFNFRDGQWHGDTFVYNLPQFIHHRRAEAKNNNVITHCSFADAPPNSVIHYKIEFEGRRELISACVAAHWKQLPEFKSHEDLYYTKGSIRVGKYRRMCMNTFVYANADPMSVRVYVTGWERGNNSTLASLDNVMPKSEPAPAAYWG
jgi:hypothetical protein